MPQHMQENQPTLETPLLTTFSNFNLQPMSHCILFLAPHGFGYDYKFMVEMAFKKQGAKLSIIGDGYRGLDEKDVQQLYELVRDTERPSYLYFMAHGDLFPETNKHFFSIGSQEKPKYVLMEDFLNQLYAVSNHKRIDVQFISCFAGAGFREMPQPTLPPHSMTFALQEKEHYVRDEMNLFAYLASHNICHGDLSANKILLSYLTKIPRSDQLSPAFFATSFSSEVLSTRNSSLYDFSFRHQASNCRAPYSEVKHQNALRHLKPFYTPEKIQQLLDHYESSSHRVEERMAFQFAADLPALNPRALLFQVFSRHTPALYKDINQDLNDALKSRELKILSSSTGSPEINATESLRQKVLSSSQLQPNAQAVPILQSASIPRGVSSINPAKEKIGGVPLYSTIEAAESAAKAPLTSKMPKPSNVVVLETMRSTTKQGLVCTPLNSPVVGSLVYSLTANACLGDGNGEMLPFHVMVDTVKLALFRSFPVTMLTLSAASLLGTKVLPAVIRRGDEWQKEHYSTEKLLAHDQQLKEQGVSPMFRYQIMVANHEAAMGLTFLKLMHAASDAFINLPQKIHDNISPKVFQSITENIRPLPEMWHGWKLLQDPDTYVVIKEAFIQWKNRSKSAQSSKSMPASSGTTTNENQSTETPRFSFTNGLKSLIFSEASASEADFTKRLEYLINESAEPLTQPVVRGIDVKQQPRHNPFVGSTLPCHLGAPPPLADERLKAAILDAQQAILELSEYAYHPMRWQETFARRGALLKDSRNLKEEVNSFFNGINDLSYQMRPQYVNLSSPKFNKPPHGGVITGDMIKTDPFCLTDDRSTGKVNHCILLCENMGFPDGEKNNLLMGRAIQEMGVVVTQIGNGRRQLVSTDLNELYDQIAHTNGRTLLIINSHGNLDDFGHHYLHLLGQKIYINDMLQQISRASNGRAVDVFSMACFSGGDPCVRTELLNGGSYIAASSGTSTYMEKRVYTSLLKKASEGSALLGNFNVDKLLFANLTCHLSPLNSSWADHPVVFKEDMQPLQLNLANQRGHKFLLFQKDNIYQHLSGFIEIPELQRLIQKIEKPDTYPGLREAFSLFFPDGWDNGLKQEEYSEQWHERQAKHKEFKEQHGYLVDVDEYCKGMAICYAANKKWEYYPRFHSPLYLDFFSKYLPRTQNTSQPTQSKEPAVAAKNDVESTPDEVMSAPAYKDTQTDLSSSEKETGYTYKGTAPRAPRPTTKEPFISSPSFFCQLDSQGIFLGGQCSVGPVHCNMGVGTDLETIKVFYRRFIAGTEEVTRDITDGYGRSYHCSIKPVPWTTKQVYVTFTEMQENGRWYADPENHSKTTQCELKKITILRHNNKGRLEAVYAELIGEFRQERLDGALQQLSSDLDALLAPGTYNPQAAKKAFADAMQPYGDFKKSDKRDELQQRIFNAIEQDVTTLISHLNAALAIDTYNPEEADRLVREASNRYAGFDFFDAGEDGLKAQLQQWMLHGKETNDVATAVKAMHRYAAEVSAVINEYHSADPAKQKTLADSLRLFKSDTQGLLRTEIERILGVEQRLHEQAKAISTHLDTERAAERSPMHSGADKLKEVTVELEHMHAAVATHATQLEETRKAHAYQLQIQPLREERFNLQTVALVSDAVCYVLNASCNDKDASLHLQNFQTAISNFWEIGLKGVSQQLEAGATPHFNDHVSFMLSMRAIFKSLFSSLTHHREITVPAYLMPITNVISAIDGVVAPIATTWQTASIEALLDIPLIKAGLELAKSTHGVDRVRYVMSYFLQHLKAYKQNPALLAAGCMNYVKNHAEVMSVWIERGTGYQLSQYVPATSFYLSNWSVLPLAALSMTHEFHFKPRDTKGEAPETFLPIMTETMCHLASQPVKICGALLASQLIDAGLVCVGVPPITTYIVLPVFTGLVLGAGMIERTITGPLQNGVFYFDSGIKSGDLDAFLNAEAQLVKVREEEAKLLKFHPKTARLSQGLRDVAKGIHDNIEPLLAAASTHARALQTLANDLHDHFSEMTTCYSVSGVQSMLQALETDHAIHGPQRDKVLRDLQQVVRSADPMLQLPKQFNEMKKQCVQLIKGVELSKRCLQLSPERINILEAHLSVIQCCIAELEKTLTSTDIEAFLRSLAELVKTDDFARLKPTEEQLSEGLRFVKHKATAECLANTTMAGLEYLFAAAKAVRAQKDLPLPNWSLPTKASQQDMFFSRKQEPVLPQRQSRVMENPFQKQPVKASMDFVQSRSPANASTLFFKPSKTQPVLSHPGVCYATK